MASNAPGPLGWIPAPAEVDRILGMLPHPVFGVAAHNIRDSGAGKVVLLHEAFAKAGIPFPLRNQGIGDCVSMGWSMAVDVLTAIGVVAGKLTWKAETATEVIYAGSRVEVGRGGAGRGDGSVGAWAAQFVKEYGAIPRGKYGDIDLTTYVASRARQWGAPRAGVPDGLEPTIHEHPVQTVSLVQDYQSARDAIANGYPVPVCSNQGFAERRDEKGFARPKGSWAHCMCFIACDDADGRPGLLCVNSWGPDWIDGPKRHNQPDGSFWVDADVVDRMLREGDSFAASQYSGFPSQSLNLSQY